MKPVCKHYGICGGCTTQDLPYAEEVRDKQRGLEELLGQSVEVVASSREYGYRTRMDYVFAWGKLGLRKRGDPRGVLDLEECHLPDAEAFACVLRVKEALHRLSIRSYSYLRGRGYLRYVTLRCAPVSGQRLLVFLTNGNDPAIRPLLEEARDWANGVAWSVSTRRADVSVGEVIETSGRTWIEEEVGNLRLRFGATSFFQANPWQTARLYDHVGSRARGRTLDLFCGVGGLALSAAGSAAEVRGVDSNREAIEHARANASANGLDRVRFECGDARGFLDDLECDTLILDPPRAGCGYRNLPKIVRAAPSRVIYVSCNPRVFATERAWFREYEMSDLRAFDLFPRTPHVELVATFDRVRRPRQPTATSSSTASAT